jgi:pilus assembly protein CpaB
MMNVRAVATLLAGVVLAGTAVYLVNQQLNTGPEKVAVAAEPPFEVANLVVAATDLEFGNRIDREHLRETPWPADSMPEGAFSTIDELLGDGSEERVALKPVIKGEPVLATKVSGFGGRATLSALLPDNKRAFSIRVNDVSGVGGFLLPGDRVDILLTRTLGDRGGREDQVTDIILQNITVRGIDQIASEDQNKPVVVRTATVEVTPEEAQKLALATQVGKLSLALRNMKTAQEEKVGTIRVGDLVRGTKKAPTRIESQPKVRVRRGSELTTEEVRG